MYAKSIAVTTGEKKSHLSIKAKESLIELSCDIYLKIKFEALSLPEFWIYIKKRTFGILTNSHRGVTTFWNDICVKHFLQ
jgi:hypothetical protein